MPRFVLRDQQRAELKEAFDVFDLEGSGLMSTKNIAVALRALGADPTKEDINKILSDLHKKQVAEAASQGKQRVPDTIDFNEFLDIMIAKMQERDSSTQVQESFKLFKDHSGGITIDSLRRISAEIGETLTEEELQEMIHEADRHGNGFVTEDDFMRILSKP